MSIPGVTYYCVGPFTAPCNITCYPHAGIVNDEHGNTWGNPMFDHLPPNRLDNLKLFSQKKRYEMLFAWFENGRLEMTFMPNDMKATLTLMPFEQ